MNVPAVPERNTPARPLRDPYQAYLDSLQSPESRRTMKGCLDRIARLITGDPRATGAGQPWERLRYEHTVRLRSLMREQGWSPAHVNKHLVALRRVLKEAWRLGLMSGEDYQRATDLPPYRHTRLPAGRHVEPEMLAAALRVCDADESPAGRRDGALLALLYSTGCRRAEVAALTLADFDPWDRSLRVRGKGDKERFVYLTVAAAERLDRWLAVRGRADGPLFCPINKAGRLRLAHMTGQAIADIVTRRLTAAGAAKRTPHDFRRTFIGELLDAGVDLATAQALVGHASPATTARYDRRPERRRRDAVDRLTIPGPRR
ncbi:integrase [Thermobispora bispora]|uniref:Integrase family protein n=1 Tax=Thermobispora bispora (strain ATCC 19993 / DSM 43833 / CBS 139.67 / JCM 10125 / KCTC 9307 / NBRC 14880 / R51) TaxID=469371 RepID=D6YB83_THEBD|nr:tyrosine-type recombinase/integrase [Thermobispora bispora]ADG88443.1 integrase family protein [Thermobispora bispora DSM 43833]MBO2475235.1 integrase [Actinomycetales bacterium]MDI9580351.1 tyrosine-type recombinase/integrase [Thermobispora sp.]QSI48256.1 integrase [Thermobispora bispora]